MKRFKVALVALDGQTVPDWVPENLAQQGIDLVVHECLTDEDLAQYAADADLVWLFGGSRVLTARNLALLPRCGAIVRTGSGTDNVPIEEATRRLVRIHDEYQAEREAFRDLEQIRKTRLEWSRQVQKAYLDLVNAKATAQQAPQDAQAQAGLRAAQKQVEALLDDSYLVSLALGEDEVGMMQKEDDSPKKAKRAKRGLLTSVVLQSTLPTLGADTAYLQALVRQERA